MAKPLTQAAFKSKPRPGFNNYQAYLSWWNKNVGPKFAARANAPEAVAGRQVDAALAPILADIQRRGERTSTNLGGIYDALAKANEGIAPQIQQTYEQAAGMTGAFSKGYSDGLKGQLDASAAEANELLQQQGSPQTVESGGQNVADVLFGLTGSIPGQALAREGAAFTAAAQQLPAQARTLGAQAQAGATADWQDEAAKIEAERPGLIQQALNEIHAAQAQQQELALKQAVAESEFGLNVRKQDFAEAATKVELDQAGQRIQNTRNRLTFDKAKTRFDQILSNAGFELDLKKYDLAVTTEARMARAPKSGGFTASQKQDLQQQAFDTAADDFLGYQTDDGTKVPPRPPVETLRDLLAAGVPFSQAVKAIQRFARGKKPGDMDGAMWNLWRATLGWTKKKPMPRSGR